MTRRLVLAMALVVIGAACGGDDAGAGDSLEGSSWSLIYYSQSQASVLVVDDTEVTLRFVASDEVQGSTGCNKWTGTWNANDTVLTLSAVTATEVFCSQPEGAMDQEAAFLSNLSEIASYGFAGSNLELFDASGTRLLEFSPL